MKCSKCGRSSHTVSSCYAKTHTSGYKTNKPMVYSLNLKGGKKYIGKTNNLGRRLDQHFSGKGAKWTQKNKPVSVNHTQKCKSEKSASKAETIVYKKMRDYHGSEKVRGAGYTKST